MKAVLASVVAFSAMVVLLLLTAEPWKLMAVTLANMAIVLQV